MTLEEFDIRMANAAKLRELSNDMLLLAHRWEDAAAKAAGVVYVNREAGFPCWTAEGSGCYYGTPREALQAIERANR